MELTKFGKTTKRIIAMLTASVLTSTALVPTTAFAECAEGEHSETTLYENYDARCVESWAEVTCCTTCGKELSRVEHEPEGHVEDSYYEDYEGRCENPWTEVTYCMVCGEELSRVEHEPEGHSWLPGTLCLSDDLSTVEEWFQCETCGEMKGGEYETDLSEYDCERGGKIKFVDCDGNARTISNVGAVGEHDWDDGVDSTGDREEGRYTLYTCRRCGLQHETGVCNPTFEDGEDPTCTEPGWEGVSYYNNKGEKKSSATRTIPALGHDWGEWHLVGDSYQTVDAQRECSRCDAVQTADEAGLERVGLPFIRCVGDKVVQFLDGDDVILEFVEPAPGHVPGEYEQEAPGMPYVQKCTVCGAELAMKSYTRSETTDPTCTEPGYEIRETSGLTTKTPIPDKPALGHDWGEWTTVGNSYATADAKRTCARCGEVQTAEDAGLVVERLPYFACGDKTVRFSDENGVVAEYVEKGPGHDTSDGYVQEAPGKPFVLKCKRCGLILEMKSYNYFWYEDPTCTEPGYYCDDTAGLVTKTPLQDKPALGHDWGEWKKAATQDKPGFVVQERTCSRCSKKETRETADVLRKVETRIEPNCETSGNLKTAYRDGLGRTVKTENSPIPATGHSFGNWTKTKTPTAISEGEETRTCGKCGKRETRTVAKLSPTVKIEGSKSVKKGKTISLKATNLAAGDYVTSWTSSKKAVATVDSNGKVKGRKNGKTTITARTRAGAKASFAVTVSNKTEKKSSSTKKSSSSKKTKSLSVTGDGLSGNSLTIKVGDSVKLKATRKPSTSTQKIKWSSSKKKVATVSGGKVVARKKGKTTITVTSGKAKKKINVKVVE